jgi:hypothetical protein
MEIRKNMQGRERWSGYLSLLSRFETAAIVQPQLAEYGQPKPRRFLVVCAIHFGMKAAAAAQAARDLPGRGRYPVRHSPLSAFIGLNIPDDLNGNGLDLPLFSIDVFVQIGKITRDLTEAGLFGVVRVWKCSISCCFLSLKSMFKISA